MALFHSNPHDVPLQVDTRHIRYSDKTDFNSGECFFTYANVPNRAVAFEIAKWFCPKDYTVVYNYESKVVDVRGDGGNPQRATEADRRFITFFRADGSTARPAGRFIRLTKISSTPEQLRITQFQVFDYAGNIIKPIQVTISPQPNPVMASYLVDDNIDPAKELVAETAPEKEVYMQLDFGSEIEIAGVRIYNALREAGTSIIGASLQVLTKSGIVVFGVPIRDNRSIYNIRTSPLQMLTRRDYGRYNEIYIFVPGKWLIPKRYERGMYIKECTDTAIAEGKAGKFPQREYGDGTIDLSVPDSGAYNDAVVHGGYMPAGHESDTFPNAGCGGGGYYDLGGGSSVRTRY